MWWRSGCWYRGRRREATPVARRLAVVGAIVAVVVVCGAALWPRSHPEPPAVDRTEPATAPLSPPDPSTSPGLSPSPAVSSTPSPVPSAPPVTYEAEAATVGGFARVSTYPGASGGRIVHNLGTRGKKLIGTLSFTVTAPAPGPYSLTFFYVNEDTGRSVVIIVSGAAPVTLTTPGGSSCCAAKTTVIALRAGPNVITFTNPADPAPALDKIVVQAR